MIAKRLTFYKQTFCENYHNFTDVTKEADEDNPYVCLDYYAWGWQEASNLWRADLCKLVVVNIDVLHVATFEIM